MKQDAGVNIFRSSCGEPTIFAYILLVDSYMTCVFRARKLLVGTMSFDQILDLVPIHSITLCVDISLEETLDATLALWKQRIRRAMDDYERTWRMTSSSSSPPRREHGLSPLPTASALNVLKVRI